MEPAQTPISDKPELSDQEREARLRQLADRLLSPEGLDRETLAGIEQLTGQDE
jgi:hypothetical protein